jgi:hypothetical protein
MKTIELVLLTIIIALILKIWVLPDDTTSESLVALPQYCPSCSQLNPIHCSSCANCGYCVKSDGRGLCVQGDANGPYFEQDCQYWNQLISIPQPYVYNYLYDHRPRFRSSNYHWIGNKQNRYRKRS